MTCLLLAVGSATTFASRDRSRLASVDRVIIESDFIGTVDVIAQKTIDSNLTEVTLRVVDTWHTRWPQRDILHVTFDNYHGRYNLLLEDEDQPVRALVFLSGGPWQESPFAHGSNSIFRIRQDGAFCRSGNPLFAVTELGFYCSIQEYMASPPSTLSNLRAQTLELVRRAQARHQSVDQLLSNPARPLEDRPSSYIDRSLPGQEILR